MAPRWHHHCESELHGTLPMEIVRASITALKHYTHVKHKKQKHPNLPAIPERRLLNIKSPEAAAPLVCEHNAAWFLARLVALCYSSECFQLLLWFVNTTSTWLRFLDLFK